MKKEDMLNEKQILQKISKACEIRYFDEIESTNEHAKTWAKNGAAHGSLVVAQKQTCGKGRFGKRFDSPKGGVYMSIVLRPNSRVQNGDITAAAAVAVCRAVQKKCGISLGIKWVNDIFLHEKKCCGILAQAIICEQEAPLVILGIGLNFKTRQEEFTKDVSSFVTSLYNGDYAPVTRAEIIAEIYENIINILKTLSNKLYLQEYRERSIILGKRIIVLAKKPYEALAVAIDDEARLVVRLDNGQEEVLSFGEISVIATRGHDEK